MKASYLTTHQWIQRKDVSEILPPAGQKKLLSIFFDGGGRGGKSPDDDDSDGPDVCEEWGGALLDACEDGAVMDVARLLRRDRGSGALADVMQQKAQCEIRASEASLILASARRPAPKRDAGKRELRTSLSERPPFTPDQKVEITRAS